MANEKQPMPMHGGRAPRGARVPMKIDKTVVKRLMSYLAPYRGRMLIVIICILLTSGASVMSSLFLETLIEDHIPGRAARGAVGGIELV